MTQRHGLRRETRTLTLDWLPERPSFADDLNAVRDLSPAETIARLRDLATSRLDLPQTLKLDRTFTRTLTANNGSLPGLEPLRLALLSSSTTSHLPPGIRLAGLRRGLNIQIYEGPYGSYQQELMDPHSGLHRFRPDVLLLALDARHLAATEGATVTAALDLLRNCWRLAHSSFKCQVIQQTLLPALPDLLGNNETRLPDSPAAILEGINQALRPTAEEHGVDLLALDRLVAHHGLTAWYDPALWYRSRHEVHPAAAALYGDHVARLIAAARGRSARCLVLDLDHTLWGGGIGDDGLEGLILGPGSALGEAFAEMQRYARDLRRRGVLLAVCSKNDRQNALKPFQKHPEMLLKHADFSCFIANWTDKATNLRSIAHQLNIGLDALVFVDDNPAERALIRRELPMVAVPELPEDPAAYVATLAAAGYFEALRMTSEDRHRATHYQTNSERDHLHASVTDLQTYLESLAMVLTVEPVNPVSLGRVTQLINKTNQFNLMTERLTESEVSARMEDPHRLTLQARLADRFGDNGIIAAVLAHLTGTDAVIDNWVMSCRVLGRTVEHALFNVLARRTRDLGAKRLIGQYRPTAKNGIVRDLYPTLGFEPLPTRIGEFTGTVRWSLDLNAFRPRPTAIRLDSPGQPAAPRPSAISG